MELHNNDLKPIPDVMPLNLGPDQYVYDNCVKTFDPNLSSAAQYSPPPPSVVPTTTTSHHSSVQHIPYNVHIQNQNQNQNIGNIIVPTTEMPNNCVTYSNIIFLPSTNGSNSLDQVVDTIELVKNETETSNNDAHSFKYVVSSDQRFLNSLVRTNDLDTNPSHPLTSSSSSFIDQQQSNMIATISGISDNNLILNDVNQMEICSTDQSDQDSILINSNQRQLAIQMSTDFSRNGSEIFMDSDGQLYRQIIGNELIPVTFSDIELPQSNQFDSNDMEQSTSHAHYQVANNFIETHSVANNEQLNQFNIEHDNILSENQITKDQFVEHSTPKSNKDQQRMLLESTMSPLLAAVNDITAREEQTQSYLNHSKTVISTNQGSNQVVKYYSSSQSQSSNSTEYTTEKSGSTDTTSIHLKSELFSTDTSNNEFVDYSEVNFIEQEKLKKHAQHPAGKRKIRKKTTKKRDDELAIVDQFVPTRAFASLPSSHLYFGMSPDDTGEHAERIVLSKREISARTKFGPAEGVVKVLTKDELNKYRKSRSGYPLMFLSQKSCLDVSNEDTSNWMRFIRMAKTYEEQNLLLCEIESQLFFKSCKTIEENKGLYVGYSKEYAEKYNLCELIPKAYEEEKRSKSKSLKKSHDWHCSKCKKQFTTIDLLQNHLEYHKITATPPKSISLSRSSSSKSNESASPVKSKHRLNTGAIRLQKLAQSKNSRTSGPTVRYACCYCSKVFTKFLSYKKHTNSVHSVDIDSKRFTVDVEHKRLTIEDSSSSKENDSKQSKRSKHRENIENVPMNRKMNTQKVFVCQICQNSFDSAAKLEKHGKTKCVKKETLIVKCDVCMKDFQNPAALAMHMKTHEEQIEIFKCLYCSEIFKKPTLMKKHVIIHKKNGMYKCPHCPKELEEYGPIRKHIRTLHTTIRFECHECGKDFNSKYKLKQHSLAHSDIKQFLCADCGRQFKRKDKLRDHIFRMHARDASKKLQTSSTTQTSDTTSQTKTTDPSSSFESAEITLNNQQILEQPSNSMAVVRPKFRPKVLPTEYQRFIYKCDSCMLGFKRRGMLVNHMAKIHPNVRIDSVHELSLPILKTERCFYCLYCEKVYKSSTKRKAHILKYHPGQPLPHSTRGQNEYENAHVPNSSFSQSIGSITTQAYRCNWCHKQYASRNRLIHHHRHVHKNETQSNYNENGKGNEYFHDHGLLADQHQSHFSTYSMSNRMIEPSPNVNEFSISNGNVHNQSRKAFNNIEPENKLLRLSSAALESIGDDLSFLNSSHDLNDEMANTTAAATLVISGSASLPKVDVNYKVGDEFVDTNTHSHCELNPFPQLFEVIDCMSLRTGHFSSSNDHNSS